MEQNIDFKENSIYSNFLELEEDVELDNYYTFKNALTNKEIEHILTYCYEQNFTNGIIGSGKQGKINKTYRSSKITWIPKIEEFLWLYDKIGEMVNEANKIWNFNLTGMAEDIQIALYDKNEGHYDWHLDIGTGKSSKRKISVSIQLSDKDEYEGGELQFLISRTITNISKEKGTAVLFPSYFLHRVKEIKSGKRISLVIWISGKPFK